MPFIMPPMLAGLFGSPQAAQVEQQTPEGIKKSAVSSMNPTPEELQFLKDTAALESSSGKDVDHPEITKGLQKGSAAIGQYGLMPNSLSELVNRASLNNDSSPNIQKLQGLSPEDMAEAVKNDPALEQEMALRMERHISSRPGITTPEQKQYMWQYGHNLSAKDLDARDYMNSDRVQSFKQLRNDYK